MWVVALAIAAAVALVGGVAVAVALIRGRFVVVTVVGESMLPSYRTGDRVLVRRARLAGIRAGDVVVIEEPGTGGVYRVAPHARAVDPYQWIIKRVVAVPGDPHPAAHLPAGTPVAAAVPAGAFAVRGDNAHRSYDSRQLGYFPAERLLGVVARAVES
jgi:signal peptidase I